MIATSLVPARGQAIEINGARLAYEEHGAGDPLLLLHGGLTSSASWREVVPLLATRFRVITPDSRGHGRSTNPGGRLNYRQIADDTVGLIAALGLERPFLGGWSDGGQVALEIALHHSHAVRALVVGAAFFNFGEEFRGSIRELVGMDAAGGIDVGRFETALGAALPGFRSMFGGNDAEWRSFLAQTVQMWLDYPGLTAADFGQMRVPVLVVAGDRDEFVPVEVAAAMYWMLPTSELAICPNASHSLPSTHPAWFAGTVAEFLGRQSASDG